MSIENSPNNESSVNLKLFGDNPIIEDTDVALEESMETIQGNSVPTQTNSVESHEEQDESQGEVTESEVIAVEKPQKPSNDIEAREKQRKSVDDGFERQLLADYYLAVSTGEMTGDDFIEQAINNPQKYPKRIVDRAVAKISKGRFANYEELASYNSMAQEERVQHDSIMENPVVREMKEFISKIKEDQEYKTIAKVATEAGIDIDEVETKYLADRSFKVVQDSLLKAGIDKETAMRKAMMVVNPYVFEKNTSTTSLANVVSTPAKPQTVVSSTPKKEESIFTTKYINPAKDWFK